MSGLLSDPGGSVWQSMREQAEVPIGNVYYFRSKDEQSGGPVLRLVSFVRHARDGADLLSAQGCPIGGLCSDLARTNADLGAEAGEIFAATIDWVAHQYAALDHPSPGQAANRLVALVQGATVLSHALRDPEILRAECVRAEHELQAVARTTG